MAARSPNPECRMYEAQYPEPGDIKGMILLSELFCRRRVRSVGSLVRVGRVEPAVVLTVDRGKASIDLSKRRVSEQDVLACEERYNKSKLVHSIMRRVAKTISVNLEDLYVGIGWPLYRKYGHAFEVFKMILTDPDSILGSLASKVEEAGSNGREATKGVPAVVSGTAREALIKNIKRRMTPRPSSIGAYIELTCFRFNGILHLKDAMKEATAAGNDECPVKIKLVASPLYVLTTQAPDKEQGLAVLNEAIEACAEAIERHKGKLVAQKAPTAVSVQDNGLLAVAGRMGHELGVNDNEAGEGEGKYGGSWPLWP